IVEGTPGSISCPDYREVGRCVVVADLLGDAVVWFELVPRQPNEKVTTAPIVEILDDGYVRLANGWVVRHANRVDRRCSQETGSLSEFIATFGLASTTIIDVATQRVTAVVCADTEAIETTTTRAPATTTSIPAETTVAPPEGEDPANENNAPAGNADNEEG
ncbi:MAG TPA: hypothetical protein PLV68_16870, partial [Ilumatobacteraceae bacterium]|nr:hypothetical protein [Ilumatobacteraceae bacterium]